MWERKKKPAKTFSTRILEKCVCFYSHTWVTEQLELYDKNILHHALIYYWAQNLSDRIMQFLILSVWNFSECYRGLLLNSLTAFIWKGGRVSTSHSDLYFNWSWISIDCWKKEGKKQCFIANGSKGAVINTGE